MHQEEKLMFIFYMMWYFSFKMFHFLSCLPCTWTFFNSIMHCIKLFTSPLSKCNTDRNFKYLRTLIKNIQKDSKTISENLLFRLWLFDDHLCEHFCSFNHKFLHFLMAQHKQRVFCKLNLQVKNIVYKFNRHPFSEN